MLQVAKERESKSNFVKEDRERKRTRIKKI